MDAKEYVCSRCNKKYKTKTPYETHMNLHKEEEAEALRSSLSSTVVIKVKALTLDLKNMENVWRMITTLINMGFTVQLPSSFEGSFDDIIDYKVKNDKYFSRFDVEKLLNSIEYV